MNVAKRIRKTISVEAESVRVAGGVHAAVAVNVGEKGTRSSVSTSDRIRITQGPGAKSRTRRRGRRTDG